MGITFAEITVSNLDRTKSITDKFLVDSGATHTLLPTSIWKKLEIRPEREVEVVLANGKVEKRNLGNAFIKYQDNETANTVILGESDDSKLLGVVTLEEMGLTLNPLKRTLSQMAFQI